MTQDKTNVKEELETLKDLQKGWIKPDGLLESEIRAFSDDLKTKAITWVKKDIEDYKKSLDGILRHKKIRSYTMFVIEKWMKRFNITEEDLK